MSLTRAIVLHRNTEAALVKGMRQPNTSTFPSWPRAQVKGHQSVSALLLSVLRAIEHHHQSEAQKREDCMTLASTLAERLIGMALHIEPQLIEALASEVMTVARSFEAFQLQCHPGDRGILQKAFEQGRLPMTSSHLIEDASLKPGSMILKCSLGTIDARLTVRIQRLIAALRTNA